VIFRLIADGCNVIRSDPRNQRSAIRAKPLVRIDDAA
jgi:hypothetical protein